MVSIYLFICNPSYKIIIIKDEKKVFYDKDQAKRLNWRG